jgi:Domain of unknown function (DUF4336)
MAERLTEFVTGSIWTYEEPFRFLGAPIGAQMTVVRLREGGLWVHSPLDVGEAVRREIDALGPVRAIVAPAIGHFRCVNAFRRHYPGARLYASPGLARRRFGIDFDAALGDDPPAEWAGEIDQHPVRGHLFLDEVVFLHRDSRTLLLTDLLFSIHSDSPWIGRVIWRWMGVHKRPGVPPEIRVSFRDHAAARKSLETILAWEFDRVLYCHGQPIESGGKDALRQAYRFLLEN